MQGSWINKRPIFNLLSIQNVPNTSNESWGHSHELTSEFARTDTVSVSFEWGDVNGDGVIAK